MPHACHRFWKCYKTLTFSSCLTRSTIPCACHAKAHLSIQKCSVPVSFLHFWLQNVHFFDVSTSKSGPELVCFVHFDFKTCFAPQRRALSRHLNFQKWSGAGVLCTFWLRNVLRATTACTFLTSQLPKGVRTWCVLYILTCKCASRHNGVQFSSSIWPDGSAPAALGSLLFDPPEPQIIGKTHCVATFLPFRASASFFFWLFLFYSSLLLVSSLCLCPSLLFICPYCRKFDF